MKLYIIETQYHWYDEYDQFTIAANNSDEVRKYASEIEPNRKDVWMNKAKIFYIGEAKEGMKGGIIMGSFNAG